jgi:hypothetical protein
LQDEFNPIRLKVAECARTQEKSRPGPVADDLLRLSDWADAFAHKLGEISKAAINPKPL